MLEMEWKYVKKIRKEIIVVFILIAAIFSLGAYLYKGYRSNKEAPVRAKFVQGIYGWGEVLLAKNKGL